MVGIFFISTDLLRDEVAVLIGVVVWLIWLTCLGYDGVGMGVQAKNMREEVVMLM